MDLGLQGKVAIISGSSDGIGLATAHALAKEGVRVVLCARREAPLVEARDTIARETGAEVLAVPCDVQQLPDVQRLVAQTVQRFGAIHILINNAGSVPSMQFTEVDDAQWHQMLEGKLLNYIRVTREVVPHMRKAGWGRIINIAGGGGRQPTATGMAVGVNNAAVINWTKSLSLQYAADGILVTAAAPSIPQPLYMQLKPGGRLIVPVGDEYSQSLLSVERRDPEPRIVDLGGCRFVKLIGKAGWPE